MFNYYRRIAEYANELEKDGNTEKAKHLREILKNENRCIFCGDIATDGGRVKNCSKCILKDKVNNKEQEGRS